MPLLLVCSLGGAPEPIVASILCDQPERPQRVIFVCSRDTRAMVEAPKGTRRSERKCSVCGQDSHECYDTTGIVQRLAQQGFDLNAGQYEFVELSDPQDLTACVGELHRFLTPRVTEWRKRGPDYAVIADFTGGTKCMSVALGLVSRSWPVQFRYVGGTARTKEGVGVVIGGRELIVQGRNPWDVLGYQHAQDAVALFNHHHYGAAVSILKPARDRAQDQAVKRALNTLLALCEGFALWDRFDHSKALAKLGDVRRNQADLRVYLTDQCAMEIERSLPAYQQRLQTLERHEPKLELVEDLLANAERRLTEGRYDDAAARCYRAIEALAQAVLAEHGFETSRVPLERLPDELRRAWACYAEDRDGQKVVRLSLQMDYELLANLDDEKAKALAQRFGQQGLTARPGQHGALEARNASILAHGFSPVSEETARSLFRKALCLAELDENRLLQFPRLDPR